VLNLDGAPDAALIFFYIAGTNVHAADLHAMYLLERAKPRL
jgi:hypothetical protein